MTGAGGDEAIVLALAAGADMTTAAAEGGVSVRTVARRIQLPDFRLRVQEARSAMFDREAGALTNAFADAVATLVELLGSPHDGVRLGAARSIFEIGSRLREQGELERRIADLEAGVPNIRSLR